MCIRDSSITGDRGFGTIRDGDSDGKVEINHFDRFIDEAVLDTIPVSYTHLDVYKRQG